MNTLLLIGLAILIGASAYYVAVRREEPSDAFRVGLGMAWATSLVVAVGTGVLSDLASTRTAASPKFYATPFLAVAAAGGGLLLGLLAGGLAAVVVRTRRRAQVRSVLQASEQAAAGERHPYPEYFSIGKGGDMRKDA